MKNQISNFVAKNNDIVVMSNSLADTRNVQVVEKTHLSKRTYLSINSTLDAERIFYFVVNNISIAEKEKKETVFDSDIFISVEEISQKTDLRIDDLYGRIKQACFVLASSFIESYKDTDVEKKEYKLIPIVRYCEYVSTEKAGIKVRLNPDLKEYLIVDSYFTQLSLKSLIKLSTKYSIILYRYIKTMHGYNYNYVNCIEIPIPKLKFMLGIEKYKNYQLYSAIKRKIIIPSISEIDEVTEFNVYFEECKEGRKVTSIKLFVDKKFKSPDGSGDYMKNQHLSDVAVDNVSEYTGPVNITPDPKVLESEESKKLINLGLSKDKVNELLDNHEPDFLMYVLAQSKADTRQGINNRAGYFLSSIDNLKGVWLALKEAKIKQEEQAKEYQQIKEQEESKRAEQNNRWKNIQTEVARDLLEENYILFTKAVAKHLAGASKSSTGSTFTDDFMNVDKAVNLQKTREVYQKLMQCRDRRDVSNLVKYQEPWLFKTICNTQNNYNWETGKYNMNLYKNISDDVLPEGLKAVI